MNFNIKNFGKIAEADIKLDGITVICGNNNTGKSTVGKALFSFYNSLVNYKQKIADNRYSEICDYLENYTSRFYYDDDGTIELNIRSFINQKRENKNQSETVKFFNTLLNIKLSKLEAEPIMNILSTSDEDILNEYVFRFFNDVMHGQIGNTYNIAKECCVKAEFKGHTLVNSINFYRSNCKYSQETPIVHRAYYINNPFILDKLNSTYNYGFYHNISPDSLEGNVIAAILRQQRKLYNDKMSNIISSVRNRDDLEKVKECLKKAYAGDTVVKNNGYFYHEKGADINFENISTGLKSFALIERMLELGILQKEDVLILDEPEIHLHSEWQIIYAELIVLLQKYLNLTVLVVTHSFQFLESLNFFMKQYGISDRENYYIPEETEKGITIVNSADNLAKIRKSLKSGMYTLADMKLAELDNGDHDEDDNE